MERSDAFGNEAASTSRRTIVILIHGIRTRAWWTKLAAPMIEEGTGATVIAIKYDYFDLLRFWCPFGICREGPIKRIEKQLQGIRENFRGGRFVVFAHSYGTYALSRIL